MSKESIGWYTTSAPNRQQLLSGNNLLILLFIISIASCGGSKNSSKVAVEKFHVKDKKEEVQTSISTKDTIQSIEKSNRDSSENHVHATVKSPVSNPFEKLKNKDIEKKSEYNLLVILPFNSGEIWKMDLSKVDNIFPKEPKQVLQYWEGMYMAIERLRIKGIKMNVQIYDNRKMDSVTERILNKYTTRNKPDIIVAPFHTKQAQLVAEFAKENKIPCFLPYNPSDKISNDNPYLFKNNPSLVNIYKEMYKRRLQEKDSAELKFHFIFKDNIKSENEIAKVLEKFSNGKIDTNQTVLNPDPKVINFIVNNKNMMLSNHITGRKKNILMIPSSDDKYINYVLEKVNALKKDVEVFGVPSWENSELLEGKIIEPLHPKILTDFFVEDSTNYHELDKIYRKNYHESINDDVIKGYDFMSFLGESLIKYGTSFTYYIQENNYQGIGSQFKYAPIVDKKMNVDNFENKSMYSLEYRDGLWRKWE